MQRYLAALPLALTLSAPAIAAPTMGADPAGVVFEPIKKPADYAKVRARAVDEIGRGFIEAEGPYANFEKAMRYVWNWGGGKTGIESLRVDIERKLRKTFGKSAYLHFELDGTYVEIELGRPLADGTMNRISGGLSLRE